MTKKLVVWDKKINCVLKREPTTKRLKYLLFTEKKYSKSLLFEYFFYPNFKIALLWSNDISWTRLYAAVDDSSLGTTAVSLLVSSIHLYVVATGRRRHRMTQIICLYETVGQRCGRVETGVESPIELLIRIKTFIKILLGRYLLVLE